MDLVFGLWADGGGIPDHGGGALGAINAPVVGPLGLVDILETRLGLGGPPTAQVVRIAAFQAALERMDGDRFWSRSLAMDPWAAARTLLNWRDELISLGWRDDREWMGARLIDLAAASREATDLAPGLSDRTASVLDRLDVEQGPPVERIRLVDSRDALPSDLRRLIDRLQVLGVRILAIETSAAAPATNALGSLQRWMMGGPLAKLPPDGTVTIATCASAPLAAELIGQWLAVNGSVGAVVAQGVDTALLDHGLNGVGQPRAGRSAASPHRGSLQLLRSAFKVSWRPFDPRALMELLVFPSSPIAGRAARRLASALEQAPGLGGEAWQAAWRDIERAEKERAGDDAKALTAAGKRIADWKTWAESPLADPATGMAVVDALAICDRAANWASRRFASTQDPLFIATVTLAETVRRALVALGHTHVSRILVERLIDQAVDTGERNPHAVAEAAVWRTTAHPGAVWQPVPSLIWWNFGPTREGTHRSPWTVEERRELTDAGCAPDDFSVSGRAASQAWERSVLNTQDRLLLVSCGLACNDEESLHPLAHRLAPALENLADRVGLEAALNSPTLALAGVDIPRAAATRAPLPAARAFWSTPSGFAARRDALVESASSIEALLSCQLMWALKYVARLRPGRVRSIPDANRLLGNLAHAIAHEVFLPGAPPSPSDAKTRAAEILEGTIDQLAAPLRLPELAEELTVARRRLPEAMAALAETLAKNGLIIEATEKQVSGTFEGILALRGAVDLVARDPAGQPVIIDLKWTRYEKPRLQELEQGNAIQLATYGKLVATDAPYRAGYFLLNQRQFATLEGAGLIGRGVIGARTFPETWAAIVASWRQWRVAADAGTLVSMGVEGFADHAPADLGIEREVRCDRCDYATICRRRGQA